MPIRPENRARYPDDWPQISLDARARANYCCEWCGVRNGAWGWRDASGAFHEVKAGPLIDAGYPRNPPFELTLERHGVVGVVRIIRIVLTVAHMDHKPENCAPENLRALCQRCHLRYDAPAKAAARRARGMAATGDLFPDPSTML